MGVVTAITVQARNPDRVNVLVDGAYRFSLDVLQVGDLGVKIGTDYSEQQLQAFERESEYGKLYARALEYCLSRPHSHAEVRDYLRRKTRPARGKDGQLRPGASQQNADRVLERLVERGYIDDAAFARYWVENRRQAKGASRRRLEMELRQKGVASQLIADALGATERSDVDELQKVIAKRRTRYADEQKLVAYLARQGFAYDDIKAALRRESAQAEERSETD